MRRENSEVRSAGLLQGWGAIADHLSVKTGMTVTKAAALKWAARAQNPLPVRKFGDGPRPRVVADREELERWCEARWRGSDSPTEKLLADTAAARKPM